MISHNKALQGKHLRSDRFGVRWVLSIVLSISVLISQSIPGMASQNDASLASWVEICGDGGSYFILVGADGQEQAPNCKHCDFCLVSVDEQSGVSAKSTSTSTLIDYTILTYSTGRADLPESPEQYWSANRGPPIASTDIKMTKLVSLFSKEPATNSSNIWSNPCV